MDESLLVVRAWLLFLLVSGILGNSKLAAAANSEHAARKLSANIPGFLSIDCGSNEDHIDEETGLLYKSDTEFINTGIVKPISPDDLSGNIPERLKKVRIFPQGKRNCYTLRLEKGIKSNNYMIRAVFKYGNYDGINQPPVFDLYLGVNKWVTVDTNTTSDVRSVYFEIIHVPSTDYIGVCLVNTGNGVPFISALELRLLDNNIYQTAEGKALTTIYRCDVGRDDSKSKIRYPEDEYDRIWNPKLFDFIPITTEKTIYTESNDDAYKLPALVFSTAAKTQSASVPFRLYWSSLDTSTLIYIYFYFAEIEKLEAGLQRALTINLNGQRNITDSIKLEYLKPLIIAPNDPPIIGDDPEFSIYAAEGSELPPILNGFEAFGLIELPNLPTALDDVEAIMEIKKQYKVTRNWQGDPCVPREYLWDGLKCSNSNPPSIISLNLSSSKLKGEIATSLSNFKAMQSLDLSYNDLTGTLPEFLAQLPNLKTLNLSLNKLIGSVPEALLQKSRDGKLILRVDENPGLCLSASCKKKNKELVIPIVASSIAAVLVLLFIFSALVIYKRKRQGDVVTNSNIKSKNRMHSYSEVMSITDNFKTIIGEGGFGKVYHGTLKDGTEVAVKLLSPSSKQGNKEFQAEAQLLMKVHHRNLVSLVGYCDQGEHKALIYEYMANGNLHQNLSVTNTNVLNWNERLQIAVDAAHGLEYLHNGCTPPIIHRDLKPSNILLNQRMQAKIADFGLSRAFATENVSYVSTCPAGTPGYLDPEFLSSRNFNKKSDVYSFGIILFELITGQPAIIRGPRKNIHMLDWVRPIIQKGDIQSIMDPKLQGEFNTNTAWKAVEIAMSCTPTAIQRPDMSNVLIELKECLALEIAHGRTQTTVTDANRTPSTNSFQISSSELESALFPRAR